MRTLKVMHVASFCGNIGDNANHKGMRKMLKRNTDSKLVFNEVEIRDFYIIRKNRKFDEVFVADANTHDLVMFGGGNFFDLWINESNTGTTIDISEEIFRKIKVPVVFYGLGCDPYKGAPQENIIKFRKFLDMLLRSPRCLLTVRNDGSKKTLNHIIGKKYAEKVLKVPDGGFFTETCNFDHPELHSKKVNIAINLAGDMLPIRFKGSPYLGYEDFIKEIAQLLNALLKNREEISIVFVPHIFADLKPISEVIELLTDNHRRERVTMAPYLQGDIAQNYLFDVYRKSDLVIGMRFHANVCSIGFNTPTIGLGTCYYKIRDLYEELGIQERFVDGSQHSFADLIIPLIESSLKEQEAIQERYRAINQKLNREMRVFCNLFNKML